MSHYRTSQRPPLPDQQHPACDGPLTLWLPPAIQPRKALPACPRTATPSWPSIHWHKSSGCPGGPLVVLSERTWHSALTTRALPFSSSALLRTRYAPTPHTDPAVLGKGQGGGEGGAGKGEEDTPFHPSSASQRRSAQRTDQKPPVFRKKKV